LGRTGGKYSARVIVAADIDPSAIDVHIIIVVIRPKFLPLPELDDIARPRPTSVHAGAGCVFTNISLNPNPENGDIGPKIPSIWKENDASSI
jgi:hypothetical protein